jgi:hypothetical protein
MKKAHLSFAAVSALAFAAPAAAHHSAAAYERDKHVTVTGAVTEYHWVNPHVWVHMRVTAPDGKVQNWSLESESVGQLTRMGWTRDSFKPGDVISATVEPLKDGSFGGLLGTIKKADGTELKANNN